ncbi:MAG: peptidoglycan DD-metalloendopeptidase family protein [Actinophytocola sp.]|uniref:murein hydrolase activator EnvC family protein n=1 Tax=Actinophytocola sp. TaxID=1872138 RepID=UPI001326F15F|nr:peptidoglycan DD-metalloendopeptidase family protein [Actinophytocola sp.]
MAPRRKSSGGPLLIVVVLTSLAWYAHTSNADPAGATPGRYATPVDGRVTSGFGPRWGTTHYGIDIAAPLGTPIRAVTDATVIEAGPASGFGLWMRLHHRDGTVTVYGHINTIDRPRGAHVAAGERIATVGARGEATGPHLHFEVWPHGDRTARVDPQPWLAQHGIHL